jgi:hypothetical protein
MTIDDIMRDLRERYEAEIQAALDWQAQDGGEVSFTVGMDRRAKDQLDAAAKEEAMKPENLLARIEMLEGKG